ncbi:MAG TPA: TetR/AcrR family transcriptional regulator [Burkholderiales bacterium]|nr:TetR/AcrR family transcriptional regulator [Burkholderiales bacterium]
MKRSTTLRGRMPAAARKRQIVETVLELVAEHGADAVSAQLIADAIGLSQPGVFRHFPTKEAIWMAVIGWLQDRLADVWSEARGDQEHPPPIWVLKRMFLGHVELIIRYPGLAKVVFSDHIRHQYPALHEQFHALHRWYDREVTTLLEESIRTSDLPSTTDVPAAATLFFCTIQGLAFQSAIARYRRSRVWDCATRVLVLYVNAIGMRQPALEGSMDRRPPSARAVFGTSATHRGNRRDQR